MRRVGVFVNEPRERVEEIARLASLDVAQLHGDETPADYPEGTAVWKAARVTAGFDFAAYATTAPKLCCSMDPPGDLYGGAGKAFDWSLARARIAAASSWPAAWTPPTWPPPSRWRTRGAWTPARASKAPRAKRTIRR